MSTTKAKTNTRAKKAATKTAAPAKTKTAAPAKTKTAEPAKAAPAEQTGADLLTTAKSEFRRVAEMINKDYGGKLPMDRLIITVDTGSRAESIKFNQNLINDSHEILVPAGVLNQGLETVVTQFIHQMVRFANAVNGVKDIGGTFYHNRKFRDEAAKVGLTAEKVEQKGFADTSMTDELRKKIVALKIDQRIFELKTAKRSSTGSNSKTKSLICSAEYSDKISAYAKKHSISQREVVDRALGALLNS